MAKRLLAITVVLIGLISFAAQNAFAVDNVLAAYIAKDDSNGNLTSFTEKLNQTFAWGVRPYLWVAGRFNKVLETWTNPLGNQFTFNVSDNGNKDLWSDDGIIINDMPAWHTNKAAGIWQWSVQALQNGNNVGDIISGTFTLKAAPGVVPEPISSTLFLLGGAALGIKKLRNRNKKA